jgi:hypothetical protein
MVNPLFTEEAELYFTSNFNIMYRRLPIDIQAGVSEYELPEDMTELMAVTYLGNQLLQVSIQEVRDKNLFIEGSTGVPYWYMIKEANYKTIRFYPTPAISIAANSNLINTGDGIKTQCILHYYGTIGDTEEMPTFLRRRLVKYYVMKQAYLKEGTTQDLKAAQYFGSKLQWAMEELSSFIRDCSGSRYYGVSAYTSALPKVPRPVLPSNYPAR